MTAIAEQSETTTFEVGDRVQVDYGHGWDGEGVVSDVSDYTITVDLLTGDRAGAQGGFRPEILRKLPTFAIGDTVFVPADITTTEGHGVFFGEPVQAVIVDGPDWEGDVVVSALEAPRNGYCKQYADPSQLKPLDLSDPDHERVYVFDVAALETLPAGSYLSDVDGDLWYIDQDVDPIHQNDLDAYGPFALQNNDVLLEAPAELVAESELDAEESDAATSSLGVEEVLALPIGSVFHNAAFGPIFVTDAGLVNVTGAPLAGAATGFALGLMEAAGGRFRVLVDGADFIR